jgi:hypothetical protein
MEIAPCEGGAISKFFIGAVTADEENPEGYESSQYPPSVVSPSGALTRTAPALA